MGVRFKDVILEGSCKAKERPLEDGCGPGHVMEWLEREVYTCERLSQIRGGSVSLTAALPVLQFDFNNPEVCMPCTLTVKVVWRNKTAWYILTLTSTTYFVILVMRSRIYERK